MKKIKRLLLRPIYWICLLWYDIAKNPKPYTFNHWLCRHGFWRLTNWLDNLKIIVPKQYHDLIKKYPKSPFITGIVATEMKPNNEPTKRLFYWYETNHDGESKITTSEKPSNSVTITINKLQ